MVYWEWGGLTTSTTFSRIPPSLLISNCLLLTVKLDLDQRDVRHGEELSLNLTISSGILLSLSCSLLSFSLYLGKFCNWLLDREILLLNHLWEYLHLCFESIKSELLTIWQSGPSETHWITQTCSQHRYLNFLNFSLSLNIYTWKIPDPHYVSAK